MTDILKKYSGMVNIAQELTEEELVKIGNKVKIGFEEDLKSMQEWLDQVKKVEDLSSLTSNKKSFPLPNSANVKLPIIAKACYEYSSSAYPEIFKDGQLVKAKTFGYDPDGSKASQAERVTKFMNYQLLFENEDWELETDKLLMMTALIGCTFKKTYYDPIRKKIRSDLCDSKEVIVNADVKSLSDARRVSHIIHLRLNDFIEAKNTQSGGVSVFLEKAVEDLVKLYENDELDPKIDCIEQHTYLDLDGDGYAEPYIVTVTKQAGNVLRIAPRFNMDGVCIERKQVCYITPIKIFVDYHFLVSPKGKFQSIGFGLLLLHLTDSCNSILNQLLDAGQLSNLQGGYKDAGAKMLASGNSGHSPGEWKDVQLLPGTELQKSFMPITYKEPSNVLHQLLGMLIESARDLTASAQINNGTQSSENAKTGATLALQQAGKKMITSINKRFYRSLTNEFRQIFDLNSVYLDPIEYRDVLDGTLAVKQKDFNNKVVHILPVADPNLASDSERLGQAQFVQSILQLPGIDPVKATKFILSKTQIPGIMDIMADPNAKAPPNPAILKLQIDAENAAAQRNIDGAKLQIQEKQQLIDAHDRESMIVLREAQAELALAQASALPINTQLGDYKIQLAAIQAKIDAQLGLSDQQHQKDMQASDQAHQQGMQADQQAHEQQLAAAPPQEATPDANAQQPDQAAPSS